MIKKQLRVPPHDHGVLGQIIAEQGNIAAETITSGTLDGDRLPGITTTKKGGVPAVTPGTPSEYLRDTGGFEHIVQAECGGLETSASPVFVTVKCSGLTAGKLPYHIDDATGLGDSPITTNGTKVSIGGAPLTYTFNIKTGNGDGWWIMTDGDNYPFIFFERINGSVFANRKWGFVIGTAGEFIYQDVTASKNRMIINTAGDFFISTHYIDPSNPGILVTIKNATGNMGIGKDAPTEKIDVNGNIRLSGALMPNNLPGTAGNLFVSGGAGNPDIWLGNGTVGQFLRGGSTPAWVDLLCSEGDVLTSDNEVLYG